MRCTFLTGLIVLSGSVLCAAEPVSDHESSPAGKFAPTKTSIRSRVTPRLSPAPPPIRPASDKEPSHLTKNSGIAGSRAVAGVAHRSSHRSTSRSTKTEGHDRALPEELSLSTASGLQLPELYPAQLKEETPDLRPMQPSNPLRFVLPAGTSLNGTRPSNGRHVERGETIISDPLHCSPTKPRGLHWHQLVHAEYCASARQLPPHREFRAPFEDSYYFRPYHSEQVLRQTQDSQLWEGHSKSNAYDNRFLERLYDRAERNP